MIGHAAARWLFPSPAEAQAAPDPPAPPPELIPFRVEVSDRDLMLDVGLLDDLRQFIARLTGGLDWCSTVGDGDVSCWHEPVTRSTIVAGRLPATDANRAWITALERRVAATDLYRLGDNVFRAVDTITRGGAVVVDRGARTARLARPGDPIDGIALDPADPGTPVKVYPRPCAR